MKLSLSVGFHRKWMTGSPCIVSTSVGILYRYAQALLSLLEGELSRQLAHRLSRREGPGIMLLELANLSIHLRNN